MKWDELYELLLFIAHIFFTVKPCYDDRQDYY